MIVISNAFVYSTCLLVVVSRYGHIYASIYPGMATHISRYIYIYKSFFQNIEHSVLILKCLGKNNYNVVRFIKILPSLNPLGKTNKLRGRYFKP
jgi:hypothetical protein